MKKFVPCFLLFLSAASVAYAQQDQAGIVSNHTISAQVLGLEYGYEQRLGGSFSLTGRIGLMPNGMWLLSSPNYMNIHFNMAPAVTLEPRFYTNFGRRIDKGKSTYKNSADFVMLKLSYLYNSDFVILPAYGIRRTYGRHWFGEMTAGFRISLAYGTLIPNVQYRFGFVF